MRWFLTFLKANLVLIMSVQPQKGFNLKGFVKVHLHFEWKT